MQAERGVLGPAEVRWNTTTATVHAVDRVGRGLETHGDIAVLGRERGEIPVVEFSLPGQGVEEFLDQAFMRIALRLVSCGVREHTLVVTPGGSAEK